jgi:glucose/arabinose dehydrogenase
MSAAVIDSSYTIYQAPVSAHAEVARPTVTNTDPSANKTNVRRDAFVAAYVSLPNVGHGVSESTLKSANVKLYKASDTSKTAIAANLNTTGGGDAIILTPATLLASNTKYTFQVTSGLTDTSGASFQPFTMSFTTGTAGTPAVTNIAFDKVALSAANGHRYTGVTIGPDGKLYAGTMQGAIFRYDIKSDGTLANKTQINSIKNGNGGQNRIITGLHFDPTSTAGNLILWVTHGHGNEEGAPNWTGKLSRLTGSTLGTYQDYVTGLPRSVRDHLTNQIDFDPQGRLYLSQGSQNAMGAPDNAWGQRSETLLSAAILRVDTGAIATRIASGQGALNVKTGDGGTYNPFASGAAVTIYASGVRNAYDLLWHSNGNLYAPTNGSAPGGNTPSGGGAPALRNVSQNEPDWLFKIRKDKYYGHPNPTRQEYVLNGGNPTSGSDKYEVPAYPVGTRPDPDWDPAIYSFGANRSPNGIIEYKSGTFGGSLAGSLLVVRYSGGDDILILAPDSSGNIPSSGVKTGVSGLTGFVDPLDLVENVGPGTLYVIEHGASKITLLKPRGSTGGSPGGTPGVDSPVRDANTVYFNDPVGGAASSARKLTIRNTTSASITLTEISLSGNDASMFRIVSKPTLPRTLAAGATVDVTVEFNPPAGSTLGLRKTSLLAKTSTGSTLTYNVRALATAGLTGANEPGLQRILDLYQLPINAGDANPSTSDMPLPLASGNNATGLQRLIKSGSGPVTIEPLSVFASSGTPTIRFGYYNLSTSARTEVATFTDSQSVNPGLTSGSFSFDPGSSAFGLYTNAPAFGSRITYSEDAKNTWEPVTANRKKMLLFPLKDKNGNTVQNAYVMGWEEVEGSYDFQDFVAVIRNVRDPNALPPNDPPPTDPPPTDPPPTDPPPTDPPPASGTVTGLTLYNAVDDVAYGPLENFPTFSHKGQGTWGFTVKAETTGTVGSVRWALDGNSNFNTENFAPFALGGDNNGDLKPVTLSPGTHTVTVTAYSGPDGTGTVLKTMTRTFKVLDNPDGSVPPPITALRVYNAVDDTDLGSLANGQALSYHALGTWGLTIAALSGPQVGSIRWGLDGNSNFRTESFAPYALGGDTDGDLTPIKLNIGTHTLTVTAFSGSNASGDVLQSVTLNFTILDQP